MEAQAFELAPAAVTIWKVTLAVVFLLFAPLSWYLLHRTWRAAHGIRCATDRALAAGVGIAGNTEAVAELDTTLAVAGEMVATADDIAAGSKTLRDVLLARAAGGGA